MHRNPVKAAVLVTALILLSPVTVLAGAVALRDFALLRTGMTEAEVLYRLGPFDYESVYRDRDQYVQKKIWYYIPDGTYSGDWITEITFDRHGRIKELNRVKP